MILVVDVDYREEYAVVAGILFEKWESEKPVREVTLDIRGVKEYVPGQFYKRELPCIKALLDAIHDKIDYILIDGYVYLGIERKPGLGKHVWDMSGGKIPVIGVAKSAFKDTPKNTELMRGKSKRPLFVTAEGIDAESAKACIRKMHGENRIPTLLKRVDQLCRMSFLSGDGDTVKTPINIAQLICKIGLVLTIIFFFYYAIIWPVSSLSHVAPKLSAAVARHPADDNLKKAAELAVSAIGHVSVAQVYILRVTALYLLITLFLWGGCAYKIRNINKIIRAGKNRAITKDCFLIGRDGNRSAAEK